MHLLTDATAAEEARRGAGVAVLPIGSFEQHGDHLPLITDTVVASVVAAHLADAYGLLLLPPVTVSCSHEHEGFPGLVGTVSISAGTLVAVVEDIRASLARSGITKLVVVNGHGGNYVLANVAQQANVEAPRVVLYPGPEAWEAARASAGMKTTSDEDMHGGELETSILLHAHPDLVRDSFAAADHEAADRPHLLVTGMKAYTTTGIIGHPSLATAAKGEAVLDSLVDSFADYFCFVHD